RFLVNVIQFYGIDREKRGGNCYHSNSLIIKEKEVRSKYGYKAIISRSYYNFLYDVVLGCSTDDENLYQDFEDLSLHEKEGIDYDINHQSAHSAVLIMA